VATRWHALLRCHADRAELGFFVGGALLVEVILQLARHRGWPCYSAIGQRDYPMLQGGF